MLKLSLVKMLTRSLATGETMRYIPLPESGYDELRTDLAGVSHLTEIEALDVTAADGLLIKCSYVEDGLLAAGYLLKKYELHNGGDYGGGEEEADEELFSCDPDDPDLADLEREEAGRNELADTLFRSGSLAALPVVYVQEFSHAFSQPGPMSSGFGMLNTRWGEELRSRKPYWFAGRYPLIVLDAFGQGKPVEAIKQCGRFILCVEVEADRGRGIGGLPHFSETIDYSEKRILFELDFEVCRLGKPANEHYQHIVGQLVKDAGYKWSGTVDKKRLVEELIDYRGASFASYADLDTMIRKAIRKKRGSSKTLTQADFDRVFAARRSERKREERKPGSAAELLNGIVGLREVKEQLFRAVKLMRFGKQRRSGGLRTADTHMAAVFMGNPGTAKTTVARLFGRLLCEEQVLDNDMFVEVGRKDLVGKYVGWTAPTVAKVFESAKGGTLFIDEAYSLLSEGQRDGYSDEALSEIIRQMENNPDTLVIFAGYSAEMQRFIRHANPGLRSRLTNVVEFKDYTTEELWHIFRHLLDLEDYGLQDADAAKERICAFVDGMGRGGSANTGNGRLMRKLCKVAIGYMAEREGHDFKTMHLADIEKAISELAAAEALVSRERGTSRQIGFMQGEGIRT